MKRIVRNDWLLSLILTAFVLAVVATTQAGAGATYLIALGAGTVALAIRRLSEELDKGGHARERR